MKWITTTNLDAWGATRTSETELPGVVSDLIRATAPDINAMRFPTGEKGQVRGFDGTLDSSIAALNIPAGRSYWEFGTEKDYQGKALRDFEKRSGQLDAAEQAISTLVLVTPFTWDSSRSDNKIEDWEKARKDESDWKAVKLIDGQQLEDWLAECPAVSAWHARNTLRVAPREGVRSTDDFWFSFADRFDPRLVEEMLTAERERQVEELLTALMGPAQPLRLVADSPDEVVAFVIAAIRTARPEVKLFLEARTLVVDTEAAVRELVGKEKLVLVARGEAARAPGQLFDIGPTVIPLGRQQRVRQGTVLERPTTFAMANVLTKMNMPRARAEALAKGCGRSLTALARQIPGGAAEQPTWVGKAQLLLPAILAGAWDGANPLDQAVVTTLAGTPSYTEYESSVRPHVEGADPALDREGTIYKVRAPMDAFIHAGHLIGREHIEKLRPILGQVFGQLDAEPDPDAAFRFPPDRTPRYSDWLRDGIATTLLLIALWQDNARLDLPEREGQRFADEVMGALPGLGSDPRLLTSLRNELPVLAEAAPEVFLSALERMLEGEEATIRPIFNEVKGLVIPTSNHTGVLWALETLAWDRRRLRRVSLILARLAELDPGGRLTNRPDASLANIFLPWHPGTQAPLDAQLAAIDEVLASHPEIGWKLLLRLLPDEMRFTTGTARPKLREVDTPVIPLRGEDVADAYRNIIARAITFSEGIPSRMQALIRPMARFGREQLDRFLQMIDRKLQSRPVDASDTLWSALRDALRQHERFRHAEWAMPADALAEVRRIVNAHAPTDPVVSVAEMFDIWALERDDHASAKERADAVAHLYQDHGGDAVLLLAKTARAWHLVLRAIDDANLGARDIEGLLRTSQSAEPGNQIAVALSAALRRRLHETAALALIRDLHVQTGNDDATAALLFGWRDERATWRAVRALGPEIEQSYWRNLQPHWIVGPRTTLLGFVLRLLHHGRAIAALESALNRLEEIPTRLLFNVLDSLVAEINGGHARSQGMLGYDIEQAMKALDARDADANEIAKREYVLLPLLEGQERPLRLHGLMTEDPDLFHSVLRDVYPGDDDPKHDERGPDESDRARWRQAYQLLSSLDRVPGFTADTPNQAALIRWVDALRALGVQHKRADVTETVIGRVLAHAPEDETDAAWPHRFVRDEIERLKSNDLEQGMQIERFNMRGVTTRGMFDGGELERQLVEKYEGYTRATQRWPRTTAMLERMAESWRQDAEREDAEVKRRRLRS